MLTRLRQIYKSFNTSNFIRTLNLETSSSAYSVTCNCKGKRALGRLTSKTFCAALYFYGFSRYNIIVFGECFFFNSVLIQPNFNTKPRQISQFCIFIYLVDCHDAFIFYLHLFSI